VASERAAHKAVVDDVSFEVSAGEIVGIAGVEGNGQSQLLQYLAHSGPRDRLGVIPEDRHLEGLLLDRPIVESFLLGLQRKFQRRGLLRERELYQETQRAFEEYDIRPRILGLDARRFSGGNQQKLIVAREFNRSARFFIAAQPTRGVDVGAIETIHARILRARAEGCGILLVSSELEEILKLSDRIFVMYDGKFVAEFPRAEATEEKLGFYMGGGHL
jgi:simple sugar transport system ATP-binding protein